MAFDNLSPAAQDLQAMPVVQTNLVSDGFVEANHIDPSLVNPWGVSYGPTGPFWVSNAGTGTTTLYNSTGALVAAAGNHAILVSQAEDDLRPSLPTGQVFNGGTGGFEITENGQTGSSTFIFASING